MNTNQITDSPVLWYVQAELDYSDEISPVCDTPHFIPISPAPDGSNHSESVRTPPQNRQNRISEILSEGLKAAANRARRSVSEAKEKIAELKVKAKRRVLEAGENAVRQGLNWLDRLPRFNLLSDESKIESQLNDYEDDERENNIILSGRIYPEIQFDPNFAADQIQNPFKDDPRFIEWASKEHDPLDLQIVDALLCDPVFREQGRLGLDILASFPTATEAIEVLKPAILMFGRPNFETAPHVLEIPVERTETHSGKIIINGVNTTPQSLFLRAMEEYKKHPDQQVTFIAVPSQGVSTDIQMTRDESYGENTLASYVGFKGIMNVLADYPDQDFVVQAFSRGSAIINSISHHLPQGNLKRLCIHTFGAFNFARNDRGFADTINYVSPNDPIPSVQCQKYSQDPNVNIEYIEPRNTYFDHYYDITYAEARENSYMRYRFREGDSLIIDDD